MCRIGDLRKSHIILAKVHLYLLKKRCTLEGEVIPCDVKEMEVSNSRDCLLFMPFIIEHQINETSPLYSLIQFSEDNKTEQCFKNNEKFEIIVTLEGMYDD